MKISSSILQAMDSLAKQGISRENFESRTIDLKKTFNIKTTKSGEFLCYLKFVDYSDELVINLKQIGVRIDRKNADLKTIQAYVPFYLIETLSAMPQIKAIRPVIDPVLNSGSVVSEGDSILLCNKVRQETGYAGAGVKIGIISDGVNGLAESRASGDLPPGVVVVADSEYGAEGTAIMEIIHDLAPGAQLYFHTGFGGYLNFIQAVDTLCKVGAKIIIDDIGYLDQPVFQDGDIAQKVKWAIREYGVSYVSSAGNSGQRHYEGLYLDINPGSTQENSHDFGGSDSRLDITIPAGALFRAHLQWNDEWGKSGNDYDVFLRRKSGGTLLAYGIDYQTGTEDPFEFIYYQNNTSNALAAYIVIDNYRQEAETKKLSLYAYSISSMEKYTDSCSIYGHPAADSAICVGAIPSHDADTVEPFSSRGRVHIYFPSYEVRQKPDLCGIDGVAVTAHGGFYNPFYGTSAAAPHIAAVAALVLEAKPSLTPREIKDVLQTTAVDIDAAGWDINAGYGRANAYEAIRKVAAPVVSQIPGQTILQDQAFQPIDLNPYVLDPNHADNQITWSVFGNSNISVSITSGIASLSYIYNWYGMETLYFVATDPAGLKDTSAAVFAVQHVNHAPVFSEKQNDTVYQYQAYSSTVSATDRDSDPLTYAALSLPSWLSFNSGTRTVSGTPALQSQVGIHGISITVHDGDLSDTLFFNVVVLNTNDAPVFVAKSDVSLEQNALYSDTIKATDMDGDVLVYGVLSKPSWLALDAATGRLSGTPLQEHVGTIMAEFTAGDGGGLMDTLAFSITVHDINDPPVFASKSDVMVDQNQAYRDTLKAIDPDGDVLTFVPLQVPDWLTLSGDGALSGTPAQKDTGTSVVRAAVSDGSASDTLEFSMTVRDVNDPPVFSLKETADATQYNLYIDTLRASDADSDPVSFHAESLPAWLSLDTLTGIVSGMPAKGDTGIVQVRITATDGTLYDTLLFAIRIIKLNRLPAISTAIVDTMILVPLNSTYLFSVRASDPDKDLLTFTWSLNNEPDTSATDSTYLFKALEIDTFIISVRVSDNDTSVYRAWKVCVDAQPYIVMLRNALPQNYYLKVLSNGTAAFEFGIPANAKVSLENYKAVLSNQVRVNLRIFDSFGKCVQTLVNEEKRPGIYQVFWNRQTRLGQCISSGMYLCRLSAGDFVNHRRFVLMR